MNTVMAFIPNLATLPASQRALWTELGGTRETFTLCGGTALALPLGHRTSVDFDFFSNASFDPDRQAQWIPYLRDAERVQVGQDTLTSRVDRGGPVLVSFFADSVLDRWPRETGCGICRFTSPRCSTSPEPMRR
ncbi:MAG: nucleotidyl transferase AbiEii/AbiGii toxin family protein [Bryobacteraceae bacterium]